jgi:hypothetical protein
MSCVYKIEMVYWIQPRAFGIVDDKFHVWQYPSGLYWTQVNPHNFCTWVLVAHCRLVRMALLMRKKIHSLKRPCPFPSSKIDNVCRIVIYRREMKMATHEREYHDVLHMFSDSQSICHCEQTGSFFFTSLAPNHHLECCTGPPESDCTVSHSQRGNPSHSN